MIAIDEQGNLTINESYGKAGAQPDLLLHWKLKGNSSPPMNKKIATGTYSSYGFPSDPSFSLDFSATYPILAPRLNFYLF